MKWACAFLLAGLILFIAVGFRRPHQLIGIIPAGILAVLLVLGFILITGWLFSQSKIG